MAVSHSFDHGSGDAAKNAMASRPKILSPMGLSSRLYDKAKWKFAA